MTGIAVGCLLGIACLVLTGSRARQGRGRWVHARDGSVLARPRSAVPLARVDPHDLPLFVHQLTALLRAGRSPHQLWSDILTVYAPAQRLQQAGSASVFAELAVPVLRAAQQAAALGMGVPDVLRRAADPANQLARSTPRPLVQKIRMIRRAGTSRTEACNRLWLDLAACLEVSERSGAPLAEVLGRYAVQLESALDAAAARDTALAGPKATAKLLSWLPLFGLALGYLTGAQPLEVLLGSLPGLALLGIGLSLMVLGRLWSSRLVAAAAGSG